MSANRGDCVKQAIVSEQGNNLFTCLDRQALAAGCRIFRSIIKMTDPGHQRVGAGLQCRPVTEAYRAACLGCPQEIQRRHEQVLTLLLMLVSTRASLITLAFSRPVMANLHWPYGASGHGKRVPNDFLNLVETGSRFVVQGKRGA